jgi:hypothetical protein
MGHETWDMGHGTLDMTHGTWELGHGMWHMRYGTWYMGQGNMGYVTWVLDLELWYRLLCDSRENSLTLVTGVFDNFLGFPLTPLCIEVLDGRNLGPSVVQGRMYYPL